MKDNKIKIHEILDNIYLSIKTHYNNHDLDIDKLIKDDINNSINKQSNNLIFKRLVFSINNANWKATSQESFWKKIIKTMKKLSITLMLTM